MRTARRYRGNGASAMATLQTASPQPAAAGWGPVDPGWHAGGMHDITALLEMVRRQPLPTLF